MIVLLLILSAFCVNAQNCRTEIFFASQNLIPRWALLDFGSYGLTNADCDDASYPIVHLCCGNGYANAQPTLSACSLATFPSTQCIMVVTGWYGCIEITNLFSETGYICHGSETVEQYSTSKIVRCECSISNFALDATIVVSTAPTLTPTMAPTATPTLSLAPTVEPTFSPATIPPTVAPSLSLALNSSPPSSMPSSAPSFAIRWEQGSVSDKRRSRKGGLCDNMCSSHGICEININCNCFVGLDNEPLWTGPDCSLRACPKGFAWVGSVVSANNMHPEVECSNKGICNYRTGVCNCFPGYDVVACQRSSCPENCNGRGECWPEKLLASKADRKYDLPWDAMKAVGCFCDVGYRGSACEFQECPSGSDPLNVYGAEAGRDCSGRGICNYETGICSCFSGFAGMRCEVQSTNS